MKKQKSKDHEINKDKEKKTIDVFETNKDKEKKTIDISEIKILLESLFVKGSKDIKKNITFYISQDGIDKLFELTNKYNISKSTFIENLVKIVYEIDLK